MSSPGYYAQLAYHDGLLPQPTDDEKKLEHLLLRTLFQWQFVVLESLPHKLSLQDWIESRMPGKVEFSINGGGKVTLQATHRWLKKRLAEPVEFPNQKRQCPTNCSNGSSSEELWQEPTRSRARLVPRQNQQDSAVIPQRAWEAQESDAHGTDCFAPLQVQLAPTEGMPVRAHSEELLSETETRGLRTKIKASRRLLVQVCKEVFGPISEGDIVFDVTEVDGGFQGNVTIPRAEGLIKDPPVWFGHVQSSRGDATGSAAEVALRDVYPHAGADKIELKAATEEAELLQRTRQRHKKKRKKRHKSEVGQWLETVAVCVSEERKKAYKERLHEMCSSLQDLRDKYCKNEQAFFEDLGLNDCIDSRGNADSMYAAADKSLFNRALRKLDESEGEVAQSE